jgi:hypothetical protein
MAQVFYFSAIPAIFAVNKNPLASSGAGLYITHYSIMHQSGKWGFGAVPFGTPCGGNSDEFCAAGR